MYGVLTMWNMPTLSANAVVSTPAATRISASSERRCCDLSTAGRVGEERISEKMVVFPVFSLSSFALLLLLSMARAIMDPMS